MEEKRFNCAEFVTNLETFSTILCIKIEINCPTREKLDALYELILEGIELESITSGKL